MAYSVRKKKVKYRVDVRDVVRWLDRLEDTPSEPTIAQFEAIAAAMFQTTQLFVHAEGVSPSGYVRTGSLRASGKLTSRRRDKGWAMNINYGGSSDGFPNDPVNYAIFELARGGTHDFFEPLDVLGGLIIEQTLREIRGDDR